MNSRAISTFSFFLIFSSLFAFPNTTLISENPEKTVFEQKFAEPQISNIGDSYSIISIPDFGIRGEPNGPRLYGRTFNIAVPKDASINAVLEQVEWTEWLDIKPAPNCSLTNLHATPGKENPNLYNIASGGCIKIAYDAVWRGVRVIGVDIIPIEYNPEKGVRFMKSARIAVEHSSGNLPIYDERLYHPVFAQLYRASLVNPESAIPAEVMRFLEWDPDSGAELLVIIHSTYLDAFQPWLDWKLEMGMPTIVVMSDTIGSNTTVIKSFIRNIYETWAMPPVYLLIVGDTDNIPTFDDYYDGIGDNKYCTIDGDDVFPDIFPGRLSVETTEQLDIMVTKHINYEMSPDTSDDWYARAVGVVREEDCPYDGGPTDSSYLAAVGYAMDASLDAGYSRADMFTKCSGHSSADVIERFDAGCNFATFRGQAVMDWWEPFGGCLEEPSGKKLPIFISITCAMGSFQGDGYPCERVTRSGSVANPTGGVAWIGQAMCTWASLERSSLSKNIFAGLFEAELNNLAAAHTYGKNTMYAEFAGGDDAHTEHVTSTLIGSPELAVWTAPIRFPEVITPGGVPIGSNIIDFTVNADGSPVENARVCLHYGDKLSYALTDETGLASIDIDIYPEHTLDLVVTGPNLYPFWDEITVIIGGVAVFSLPVEFIEETGDGDGLVNPGETIAFVPVITNLGDESSAPLSAVIRIDDPLIEIIDSACEFPAIAPGDTVAGDTMRFIVSTGHDTGFLHFTMFLSGDPGGPWERSISQPPQVHRFILEIADIIPDDATPYGNDNGIIEPGEQFNLDIIMLNETQADCFNIAGKIIDCDYTVAVFPEAFYGDLLRESSVSPEQVFSISVSPETPPGTHLYFDLVVTGECTMYEFCDTFELEYIVGGTTSSGATGPDDYGYFIIDDTDILTGIEPEYVWNDITEIGDRMETITDADDYTATFDLPFTMMYYGSEYDEYAVSSNGFLALPTTSVAPTYPQPFPNDGAPAGIIASMWSDLAPHRDTSDIYEYYDEDEHKMVIQYDKMEYYYGAGSITYQTVICNPDYYPTPTGDSEIYIYYKYINNPSNFGVGIESPNEMNGVQYYYLGDYGDGAAVIESERALRITTIPPPGEIRPWLYYLDSLTFDDTEGNDNGIPQPGEIIGMRFRLKNGGSVAALATSAQAMYSEYTTPLSGLSPFGDIPPDETAFNDSTPIRFHIPSGCPENTQFMFPVEITANSGDFVDTIGFFITVGENAGIDSENREPEKFSTVMVYPNPFNSSTEIILNIESTNGKTDVNISVYSLSGKKLDEVYNGQVIPGKHVFKYTPDVQTTSGIYFLKIENGERTWTTRILLIR